jgi:sensor histidine kinase YesM
LKRDKKGAYRYLNNFLQLLRGVLNYGNKNEITIDEEVKLLNHYLSLESLRYDDPLAVNIKLAKNIQYEKIPPMIIQPFVENAVKHGFSVTTKRDKKICIQFDYINEDVIQCKVYDNGLGLTKTNSTNKTHQSFASAATKNRLVLMKQFYNFNIGLDFINLLEDNSTEYSTLVVINIPILS